MEEIRRSPPGMYETSAFTGLLTTSTGAGFLNHQQYYWEHFGAWKHFA